MSSTGHDGGRENATAEPDRQQLDADDDNQSRSPSYDDNYESSEESDREGRFRGPDSSWRFYTKGDRAIAASLDQSENNDLSAHLYNAHAWKRQLYDVDSVVSANPWFSKRRWIQTGFDGKLPFLPPFSWTAWPLRPEDVPRSTEEWEMPATGRDPDPESFAKHEPWVPSRNLQESLEATFLRVAKDNFLQREQASSQIKVKDFDEVEPLSKDLQTDNSDGESSDDSDFDPSESSSNVKLEKQDSDADVKHIAAFSDDELYNTSVLLDEDAASSVLRPTIRHLTARLDNLLIALHKSRLGHRQERSPSRGRSAGSSNRSRSRGRTRSAVDIPSKRKRAASTIQSGSGNFKAQPQSDVDELEDVLRARSRSRSARKKNMLGPRDWSEVLGVASLMGWDQDALDRATRRCATIFGESTTMCVMPETSVAHPRDRTVQYLPQMDPATDSDEADESESQEESYVPFTYACPDSSCVRNKEPFEKRWRLREHLKKKHKVSKAAVEQMVPLAKASAASDVVISDFQESEGEETNEAVQKVEADGSGYACPEEACDRHRRPYETRWRLREHLKKAHKVSKSEAEFMVPLVKESTPLPRTNSNQLHLKDATAMAGTAAVRLDGFMQPVDVYSHREKDKRPRKRSTSRARESDSMDP